jgi:hypothetical protein
MEVMFMNACQMPRAETLPGAVFLNLDPERLDFERAREVAFARAKTYYTEPMLMSWYDRGRHAYSPVGECCSEEEPSWVSYAKGHGGNLTVDINHEDYVFIFRAEPVFA